MDLSAERAQDIIRNQLRISEDSPIGLDALIRDLGADDLDSVEIILALEKEFERSIPNEVAERMRTFGDVVEFLHTEQPLCADAPTERHSA